MTALSSIKKEQPMRIFLIVLDSVGAGALPDAAAFGDEGSNTLASVAKSPELYIPNLISLGIGNIEGLSFLGKTSVPEAAYGRCAERSMGKDTVIGHWEIAGLVSPRPLPTYPNGFPEEIITAFSRATGRGVLVNSTYSGTKVINDYGDEHVRTGSFIVYTSADSVFQIAAHEEIVSLNELYSACEKAREILKGDHAVGRVIARPFVGDSGCYTRTSNRRDFALAPQGETVLDRITQAGKKVLAVGKIEDIFAGRGITESVHTTGNTDGMEKTLAFAERDFDGLCFVNLVDYDSLYGHRRDRDGYARALSEFDRFIPELRAEMKGDDVLIITADHGCDPDFKGTDHTREYVPLLICGDSVTPVNYGTKESFSFIAERISDLLGV